MKVTAYNPSVANLEKSYLSAPYVVGTTAIKVRNNDRFSDGDRVMLGHPGHERTEIVTASSINADKVSITVGATKFPHDANDPIYKLTYDQIKFYRSTTGISGTYNVLTTVDIDVDNSSLKTIVDDSSGLSSYYYKVSFYNSVTTTESALSDPIAGSGYARTQVGYIVNEFLQEISDPQQEYITIPQIIGLLNECNDDLMTQNRRPYRFLRGRATANTTTDSRRVPLPDDLIAFDKVKYNYVFGGTDRSDNIEIISLEEFEYYNWDNNPPVNMSNAVYYAAIDDVTNELVLAPTISTGESDVIEFTYWKKFDEITSLSDTIQTPNPRIYKLFLLGRFYLKRGTKDRSFLSVAQQYMQDYGTEVVKMQRAYRVDVGTPMGMKPDMRNSRGLRR